jgi:hypothetical protein
MYSKYIGCVFPTTNPERAKHYIDLYDDFYETFDSWKLFCSEMQTMSLRTEAANTMHKIIEVINKNNEYIQFMASSSNQHPSQHKTGKQESASYDAKRLKNNVYVAENEGLHFLSVDMKSAIFTVLRDVCPSIFTDSNGVPFSRSEKASLSPVFLIKIYLL